MARYFEFINQKELEKNNLNINDCLKPNRSTKYSAGYDFYSPIEILLKKGESIIIPTGIKADMNEDEFLAIYIRSSYAIKYHINLLNQVGIIDKDYYSNPSNDGHIMIALVNNGEDFLIKKGDKIAQGIFQKYLLVDDDSTNSVRTGGIGSTGK